MPNHLPPIAALRAFESVARLGSFTAAARELCLTQAAISQQMKVLEEVLDCRVLFRSNRSVVLTQQGERYVETVREVLGALSAATTAVRREEVGERLAISCYPSFAARWLVPRLGLFTRRHPKIRVRIEATQDLVDFRRDPVDIGIRFGRGPWSDTNAERLMLEDLSPVAAPSLLKSMPVRRLDDLRQHVALHDVACDGAGDGWDGWLELAGSAGIVFKGHLTFSDSFLLLDAALNGLGIAMGRGLLVADDVAVGRLVTPFDLRLSGDFAYWLVTPAARDLEPSALAFREWILEAMGDGKVAREEPIDTNNSNSDTKVVALDNRSRA
jgi:LysR family glycine cleavage system transcriptional activator